MKDSETTTEVTATSQDAVIQNVDAEQRRNETIENDAALARLLQQQLNAQDNGIVVGDGGECSVSNDEAIAQELNNQMIHEHNENISRLEARHNGSSKLSLSFERYKYNRNYEEEYDDDEDEYFAEHQDWDSFDSVDRMYERISKKGYINDNGKIITKHDMSLNGQRNMKKLMCLPSNIETGDAGSAHFELSNAVYRNLRNHSKKEKKREIKQLKEKMNKDKKELIEIYGVDRASNSRLNKLLSDEGCSFSNFFQFGKGKESIVFHVNSDGCINKLPMPCECALKVYHIPQGEFKQRDLFIKDDYRFKGRYNGKIGKTIDGIKLWGEKEKDNLRRMKNANIPCPDFLHLHDNILIISFIGKDSIPAPKLKDATMSHADYYDAYEQIVKSMKDLYHKANLIHADLSEYNILWFENLCYFVDVSQAVEPGHEGSFEFLKRDCKNIIDFFKKKKLEKILTTEELFKEITGCDYNDSVAIQKLEKFKGMKRDPYNADTNYLFDNHFDTAQTNNLLLRD